MEGVQIEGRTIFVNRILSSGLDSWAPNTDQEKPIMNRVIKKVGL